MELRLLLTWDGALVPMDCEPSVLGLSWQGHDFRRGELVDTSTLLRAVPSHVHEWLSGPGYVSVSDRCPEASPDSHVVDSRSLEPVYAEGDCRILSSAG